MDCKGWDWSDWKDPKYWERLLEKWKDAPKEPGVYIVCANRPIARLQGKDKHGMLTIGESQNLRQRLRRNRALGGLAVPVCRDASPIFTRETLGELACGERPLPGRGKIAGHLLAFSQRITALEL